MIGHHRLTLALVLLFALALVGPASVRAQTPVAQPNPGSSSTATAAPAAAAMPRPPTFGMVAPAGYVIGPSDVLSVVFWREDDLSRDVIVRPDGMISLPLLNDVHAAGLTPEALRLKLVEAAADFIEAPEATVVVKAINSRRVFITGQVAKPGEYLLTVPTTVVQLIAMAGGLNEYADEKNVVVLRTEGQNARSYRMNYHDVARHRNLQQNIQLQPGDTVIVP